MTSKRKINRSSETGKFVDNGFANDNPSLTVTEILAKSEHQIKLERVRAVCEVYLKSPSTSPACAAFARYLYELIEGAK